MAGPMGAEKGMVLLRALPADVAEQLLTRMDTAVAGPLRDGLAGPPPADEPPAALDDALAEFFDLQRILDRGLLFGQPDEGQAAGGKGKKASAGGVIDLEPAPVDPIVELRELSPEKLLKVLDGEPPAVTALLLVALEPSTAAAVLKGLPAEQRVDVAVRFSLPGTRNYQLLQQLARAVVDKGRRLAEQPSEAAPDARITDLAAMLRSMPRPDRVALLEKMATTDKVLTDKVREKLFKFADVLKLDDRSLQGILSQLNLKSIALALKGVDEAITAKVTNNISSRARELLQEEIGLLGTVPPGETEAAQKEVTNLIRQGEEEGKFVLGE